MADTIVPNTYLVHERNLDQNLRAKINGIIAGQPGADVFKGYVKQDDLDKQLSELENTIQEKLDANKNEFDATYYKKTDVISKDSLAIAYQDIHDHENRIVTLERKVSSLDSGFDSRVENIVNNVITGSGGSGQVTSGQFNALKNQVNQNTNNITTNANSINTINKTLASLQNQVTKNTNALQNLDGSTFRRKDVLIGYNDLSDDVKSRLGSASSDYSKFQDAINQNTLNISANKTQIQNLQKQVASIDVSQFRLKKDLLAETDLTQSVRDKLDPAKNGINDLKNTKQDKIHGQTGNLVKLYDSYVSSDTLMASGNYVLTTAEAEQTAASFLPDIYVLQDKNLYAYKDAYSSWNESVDTSSNLYDDNTTAAANYQRIPFGNNYTTSPADVFKLTDNTMTFPKAGTFTFGFYGTAVRLTGTLLKASTGTVPTVPVTIDGDMDYEIRYQSYDQTRAENTPNVIIWMARQLSVGRHTITLHIPAGCQLVLQNFVDIDKRNGALLKPEDILTDFTPYPLNGQDNWPAVPVGYSITKDAGLFDLSTKKPSDVYDITDWTPDPSVYNKLLYSAATKTTYVMTPDEVYTLTAAGTSSEKQDVTLNPGETKTITADFPVTVYIQNPVDTTYAPAVAGRDYKIFYSDTGAAITNTLNMPITYRIYR